MTDLTDIEFDHSQPAKKRRAMVGGITYEQHGVIFNAGYVPIRFAPTEAKSPDESTPTQPKKKKNQLKKKAAVGLTAKERARQKLAGFKPDDSAPDSVKLALKEDAQAMKAEELAE